MYTLVVIDMQSGFLNRFDEYGNTEAKKEVIKGVKRAVVKAIADGAEIIDVNYDSRYGYLGPTIPEIADLWKGYRKLFKKRVSYVEKSSDGGGREILANGVAEKEIRVCGINAGACVKSTVCQLDKEMVDDEHILVIADAVANAWSYSYEGDLEYMDDLPCVDLI